MVVWLCGCAPAWLCGCVAERLTGRLGAVLLVLWPAADTVTAMWGGATVAGKLPVEATQPHNQVGLLIGSLADWLIG